MNKFYVYIFIIVLLLLCVKSLQINKEKYENESQRPPGPWGTIGTGKPWYDYPYILHNIEYYPQ